MRYKVTLLESNKDISDQILQSISYHVSSTIDKIIPTLSSKIKSIVQVALESEPEYSSLKNGDLRKQFGISNTSNVDIVIKNLVSTLQIIKNPINFSSTGIKGGFKLTMIPSSDFGGVLGDDSASVVDGERGYSLPWLEWLLLKGNDILVRNYSVRYGSYSQSRTGEAIMVKDETNWRVPPEYIGTITNNWTTRAMDRVANDIETIIQSTLVNAL